MRNKEQGFVEEVVVALFGLGILLFIVVLVLYPFVRWQQTEDLVSGIVYNNKNEDWPMGNTTFSVRASTDTYVNASNESSFCLPKGSPYIGLVKEAAANKSVKVVVTTKKAFKLVAPFTCLDNVVVTRQ